jgi:hypothetical protein
MSLFEYIPTPIETERRNRIRLSLFAYAYEFKNESLISDHEYDTLSRLINKSVKTGNKKLDKFFMTEFEPDTGMWIRKHPELDKLAAIFFMYKNGDSLKYLRFGQYIVECETRDLVQL